MTDATRSREKRSIFSLISDVPGMITGLIRAELESLKNEITGKLKAAGIGIGLLVAAAFFAFFLLGVLVAAAVLGIATALPAWLAALIVAGGLLIITAILALIGISQLKRGVPPAPTKTISSVKRDVRVIKGTERRD